MPNFERNTAGRLPVVVAVLISASGAVGAQSGTVTTEEIRRDLATPDSRIEAGLGVLSGQTRRLGQFSGLDAEGIFGLLDLNLINRDDATGTWLKLRGRNLGLETREFRFDHEQQGNWSYFVEGGRIVRNEAWKVRTGLAGIGTNTQVVSNVPAKRDLDLKIDRDTVGLGVRKFIVGGFDVRVSFKQEVKRGDRMYGRGTSAGTGTMEFLAEPLDRTTRQWEIIAGYADKKLQLSGGYSGSSFENRKPVLNLNAGATGFTTEALPPSNEAHQIHLAGGYNFGDGARTSFKLSHALALQDSAFAVPTAVRPSLGGRMVTTLGFADLTLRPADRLDLTANIRYEDRDDQTAVARYLTPALPTAPPNEQIAGVTGFNKPRSLRQLKGVIEAGYQLDDGYRIVASIDEDQVSRNIPSGYLRIAYRQKTDETTTRLEVKRSLSETLNGSVAVLHGRRAGSVYVNDTYNASVAAPTNLIRPLMWADRSRDKLRIMADWVPEESWSAQLLGEYSSDIYSGRTLGPRRGTGALLSADVTYAINTRWKVSGWVSQERNTADQTTHTNFDTTSASNPAAVQGVLWEAKIRNHTTSWGLSLNGRPRDNLELKADLSSSTDVIDYGMGRLGNIGGGAGTAAPTSLPEYFYRQIQLKLTADYALERNSGIRGTILFDHRRNNDWTWDGFTYTAASDGTTVTQPRSENSNFIGFSYYYRWH